MTQLALVLSLNSTHLGQEKISRNHSQLKCWKKQSTPGHLVGVHHNLVIYHYGKIYTKVKSNGIQAQWEVQNYNTNQVVLILKLPTFAISRTTCECNKSGTSVGLAKNLEVFFRVHECLNLDGHFSVQFINLPEYLKCMFTLPNHSFTS